jgi:hypothetical protein
MIVSTRNSNELPCWRIIQSVWKTSGILERGLCENKQEQRLELNAAFGTGGKLTKDRIVMACMCIACGNVVHVPELGFWYFLRYDDEWMHAVSRYDKRIFINVCVEILLINDHWLESPLSTELWMVAVIRLRVFRWTAFIAVLMNMEKVMTREKESSYVWWIAETWRRLLTWPVHCNTLCHLSTRCQPADCQWQEIPRKLNVLIFYEKGKSFVCWNNFEDMVVNWNLICFAVSWGNSDH